MIRRSFVRHSVAGGIGLATVNRVAAAEEPSPFNTSTSAPPAFELDELTIADLHAGMASGKYTAVSLAREYLDRIAAIDKHGPTINSVIELNPDALSIAAEV